MNVLKNKIILFGFRWLPAVSMFEICDKIRPYLKTYHLHLTDNEIRFPESMLHRLYPKLKSRDAEQYLTGIPYRNIVIIRQNRKGISIFLRSGHVFTFASDNPVLEIMNVFPTKKLPLCKRLKTDR